MNENLRDICDKALDILGCMGKGYEILSVEIRAKEISIHLDRLQDFAEIKDFSKYEAKEVHGYIHHRKSLGMFKFVALEEIKGGEINE